MKLREKLIRQYLPMWAKETVFYENEKLKTRIESLERENEVLKSFIKGFKLGAKMDGGNEDEKQV